MLKVLHVIPSIAARYGGPSQAIRFMCKALASQDGVHVELATTDADGAGRNCAPTEVPGEFPVHVFHRTFSERWKYSRDLAVWLRQHVAEFDLVHIHGLWNHAACAAAHAARRAGVPYIIRPAGMLSEYSLGHRALIKRLSWTLVEKAIVSGASAFHATTQAEADDIRAVWPAARTFVVANGVDDAAFFVPIDRETVRQKLFADRPARPIVLFLSRLHPKKGVVDLLLPAFAALTNRPLLLLAGGPDDHDPGYAKQVETKVTELAVSDDVVVLGTVNGQDRWSLIDAADVFVLPSHSENFGIVVAEAMARGCPVIVTDQVQIQKDVQDANAGMVVSCSANSVSLAIHDLLANKQTRERLGLQGREHALRKFQWASIGGQLASMYRLIVSKDSL